MTKTTALDAQNKLTAMLRRNKEDAASIKAAHAEARKAIQEDPMTSDLAKRGKLDGLLQETKTKLADLQASQVSSVKSLRDQIEKEMRGGQPADANSVLLRRDAADRVRKLDRAEAMGVLQDALANGDDSYAHAIGVRARNEAWLDVAEAYKAVFPQTADSAEALAYVEANTSGAAYALANQITFKAPEA